VIFKRCGCQDPASGRRLGRTCPQLAQGGHGSWYSHVSVTNGCAADARKVRGGLELMDSPMDKIHTGLHDGHPDRVCQSPVSTSSAMATRSSSDELVIDGQHRSWPTLLTVVLSYCQSRVLRLTPTTGTPRSSSCPGQRVEDSGGPPSAAHRRPGDRVKSKRAAAWSAAGMAANSCQCHPWEVGRRSPKRRRPTASLSPCARKPAQTLTPLP
jgi:hypothetical protein